MERNKQRRSALYLSLALTLMLMLAGVVMLARTFTRYNDLSLQRQDAQLRELVKATDQYMAVQIKNFHADLSYVLGRRGFVQAEAQWALSGETEELLSRMQENLVMQNPMIRTMLALENGKIFLSTDGEKDYRFPAGMESLLQPCFASDGTMFIALIERTEQAEYAALIDADAWYGDLAALGESEGCRLMLLGRQGRILLHQWDGRLQVSEVEALNADNCDIAAVRQLMESRVRSVELSESYRLTYPGESSVHEMRMTSIPDKGSANGYFIVGITSDYDEIVMPMNRAAIQLIVYGGMLIGGMLLLLILVALHIHRHDRALRQLMALNDETQKLLEKTQTLAHHQRLETIGTLTASIAHEFNNLLTPIMGYSILTLEGLPPECEDLADNVTEIYESSRKAKTIISRLSDLSRRNVETAFRPLRLEEIARRALEVASPAQPAHVQTHVNCTGECRINGNETQLSQLLLNLVLNAFHAMEESGGTLTISVSCEDGCAMLGVADTGAGIPSDVLPHIFEPFFTTKGSGRGTGLGLPIVQQVAQSHGGTITVQSTVGEGTVFTVCFPLIDQPENEDS